MTKYLSFTLNTGDSMPMIGVGTYMINGTKLIRDVLDVALAAGYRLIDTAKAYENEEDIGKALKVLLPKYNLTRQDIFITTKLAPADQGQNAYAALKTSLKKLDCGYIDLYLIHSPRTTEDISSPRNALIRAKSWEMLVKAQREGLTRNIGVSNFNIRHLNGILDNNYGVVPAVNQVQLHPHQKQLVLREFCDMEGIVVQAWYSLGGTDNPELLSNKDVKKVAKKLGKTPAQVLLKWACQEEIAIIPKSCSKKHIEENIELDFVIPEEEMNILNSFPQKKNPDNVA